MGTLTSVLSLGQGEEEDETETTLVGCHKISICQGVFPKAQAALVRCDKPTHPRTQSSPSVRERKTRPENKRWIFSWSMGMLDEISTVCWVVFILILELSFVAR